MESMAGCDTNSNLHWNDDHKFSGTSYFIIGINGIGSSYRPSDVFCKQENEKGG